jgi:hypothetical protein
MLDYFNGYKTEVIRCAPVEYNMCTSALPPGKGPPVPTVQEAGWAPEPVWTQRIEEKSFAPAGDRTPIARSSSP